MSVSSSGGWTTGALAGSRAMTAAPRLWTREHPPMSRLVLEVCPSSFGCGHQRDVTMALIASVGCLGEQERGLHRPDFPARSGPDLAPELSVDFNRASARARYSHCSSLLLVASPGCACT